MPLRRRRKLMKTGEMEAERKEAEDKRLTALTEAARKTASEEAAAAEAASEALTRRQKGKEIAESPKQPVRSTIRAPRELPLPVAERDPELEAAYRASKLERGNLSCLVCLFFLLSIILSTFVCS